MGLVAQHDGLVFAKKRGDATVSINCIVSMPALIGGTRARKLNLVVADVSANEVVHGTVVSMQLRRCRLRDGSTVELNRSIDNIVGVNGLLVFVNELNADVVASPFNRTNGQSLRDSNPFNLALALNRAHLDLHRQPIGDVFGGDRVLAVLVGGDRVDGLDRGNLHALGGSSRELQLFVRGDVGLLGGGSKLFAVDRDSGALGDVQIDGSNLALLGAGRSGRPAVVSGIRAGGAGLLVRRLLGAFVRRLSRRSLVRGIGRAVGLRFRIRRGGVNRRVGRRLVDARVVYGRRDVLACLFVGHRGGCKRRRAHHLRGEQDRQDDRRRLDAEIPPSSQDSTVGLHKTPPTFSAAISRGSSSPDRAAPCVPTWEPNFHSGIPARDVHSSAIRRRTPTRRVKIIASIFTTNTHPGFSAKNELGRQRNECIPDRCYFLTFRNERGVSGHQCGNRAAAPRNECRQ